MPSFHSRSSDDLVEGPLRMSSTRHGVEPDCSTLAWWRWKLRRIVSSTWFDTIIGLLVVLNAIQIGVEQSYRLDGKGSTIPGFLLVCENLFLSIYVVELMARFFGFGLSVLDDNWVKFDCLLVVGSVVYSWVLQLFELGSESGGLLVILRTVRLARLARTLRLLIRFRVLWMLVRGLLSSAETMLYTLIVLLIMLYVFATIGTELITLKSQSAGSEVPEEFQEIVDHYFSTLPDAMLTLMQFACLDGIGAIYRPMIRHDYFLAVYFMAIILVIPVVLMNLVTAIIVNGAMEQATSDKDAMKMLKRQKQQKLMRTVQELFHELDEDGSGKVTMQEMRRITEEASEILCHLIGLEEDPIVIFEQLDVDGSGELDIDEFCLGIWNTVTAQTPMEIKRIEKQMKVMLERQVEADRLSEDMRQWMRQMQHGIFLVQDSLNCKDSRRLNFFRSNGAADLDDTDRSKNLMGSVPVGSEDMPLGELSRDTSYPSQGQRSGSIAAPQSLELMSPMHSTDAQKPSLSQRAGAVGASTSLERLPQMHAADAQKPPISQRVGAAGASRSLERTSPVHEADVEKLFPSQLAGAIAASRSIDLAHAAGEQQPCQGCVLQSGDIESVRRQLFEAQATIAAVQLRLQSHGDALGSRRASPRGPRQEPQRSVPPPCARKLMDAGASPDPLLPSRSRSGVTTKMTGQSIDLAAKEWRSERSQLSWAPCSGVVNEHLAEEQEDTLEADSIADEKGTQANKLDARHLTRHRVEL